MKVQNNVKTSCKYNLVPSLPLKKKILLILAKRLLENRNWTFPAVRYFTWKLELFSNILSVLLEKWDPGTGRSTEGGGRGGGGVKTWDQDPKMSRWAPGPGTPKVRPGTWFTKIFKRDPDSGPPKWDREPWPQSI